MKNERELAFRYDLFITPAWRDRFDTLVNESLDIPSEGQVLDVNCGTGAHTIELGGRLREKGEVVGVDPSAERIELARAKVLAAKLDNVTFQREIAPGLPFPDSAFDLVIGDASMNATNEIEDLLSELVRLVKPQGLVVLKLVTRGSFDEFFSLLWEALLTASLIDEVWPQLEQMMTERYTVSDAELMAARAGLRKVASFTSKEEFSFETGNDFLTSPLIEDFFLDTWMAIVPQSRRLEVRQSLVSLVERERQRGPYEVSIKATVLIGTK
jgi:ubiquinone/menaquinone biosynthesis C-methylase UbiE